MKKGVWLYRVSTLGQVDPKDNIPMQRRECRAFIEQHEDWAYYDERMEKGVSGYKVSAQKRDVILEIRAMAEQKEFDVLLVFMFDRLGRRGMKRLSWCNGSLSRALKCGAPAKDSSGSTAA